MGGIVATRRRFMETAFYRPQLQRPASALDNRCAHWNTCYWSQLERPQLELLHHTWILEFSNNIKRKVGIRQYHLDWNGKKEKGHFPLDFHWNIPTGRSDFLFYFFLFIFLYFSFSLFNFIFYFSLTWDIEEKQETSHEGEWLCRKGEKKEKVTVTHRCRSGSYCTGREKYRRNRD